MSLIIFVLLGIAFATTSLAAARPAVQVTELRVDHLTCPLGIDNPEPAFSWRLTSSRRGVQQTAYQVQVATREQLLETDKPDVWDGGKLASSNSVCVRYTGKSLKSRTCYFWRVRVWDDADVPSEFSAVARFETAFMQSSDWSARWIGVDDGGSIGYRSQFGETADTVKWVQVDLGEPKRFSTVVLYPAASVHYPTHPTDPKGVVAGFGFPVRYRIEASDDPQFKDIRVLADRTATDQPEVTTDPVIINVGEQIARYVRVTATKLVCHADTRPLFALAEIEVRDQDGQNIADGAAVEALDSIEEAGWGKSLLTDGERVSRAPLEAAMLRREFALDKPIKQARAYVTGLGYYELWINGKRVGDRFLDPARTTYEKRVYYSVYDVTKLLKRGRNCVGAMLGQGWWWGRTLTLLAQVEVTYADGTRAEIVTDQSWRSAQGPITDSWIFGGDTYDARLEQPGWNEPGFSDGAWTPATVEETPTAKLSVETIQPIKVIETLKPKSFTPLKDGGWVYDFGQNIAGWCRLSVAGKTGTVVKLRHAELLHEDGTINTDNLVTATQTDTYILKGQGTEVYEPRFVYHGFRYVQVEGFPGTPTLDSLQAPVVHTALEPRGSFSCSNDLLNRIYQACLWTQRDNYHSIPTDCPQRDERGGWMGDAHVSSYAMLYSFDMPPAYTKFLQDIEDIQGQDGRVPGSVPEEVYSQSDPMWALGYPMILWRTYLHTGDKGLLAHHYKGIKRYVEMLRRETGDACILTRNAYGDWLAFDPTPGELISTASYLRATEILAHVAGELGKSEDAESYADLRAKIAAAFNAEFLDAKTSNYGSGSQLSNALPLAFGIVPDDQRQAVLASLVKDVEKRDGHLSTGVAGTSYLMSALSSDGRADLAYRIATQTDVPSWGFMLANGATTIWEYWKLRVDWGVWVSLNHPAQAFVSGWYYDVLAGLAPDPGRPGWEHFTVKPHVVGDLTWAKSMVETIRGVVESDWKLTGEGITLKVTVPANTTATVYVPTIGKTGFEITEGGKPVWRGSTFVARDGVNGGRDAGEWIAFEVGSGDYAFELATHSTQ